ncbi:MAG: DNA mismatch repair protein MutS, partial [Mogibacterium sp.]|nr:DNA mismatch repair protein MutS [Mogibacterium sp.]
TVEFLCRPEKNIRTMFATHYHELTELCVTYPSVCNLSVAVAEDKNDIVFLHNIVEGPASKSYGIHVAKIAGVPSEIRNNAIIKLRELEEGKVQTEYSGIQLSFVNEPVNDTYQVAEDLVSKIADVDINVLTPLNAMNLLSDFISEAKEVRGGFDD